MVGLVVLAGTAAHMGIFVRAYSQLASVFFIDSSTPETLLATYHAAQQRSRHINVLIVPGHDAEASGTSYRGLVEADLTLATGLTLQKLFAGERFIDAQITRTSSGYVPALTEYFTTNRRAILAYRANQFSLMQKLLGTGEVASNILVDHNYAPDGVSFRLYGINKWANENNIDLLVHIHYNDIPRKNRNKPGPYSGFAIYIPEHQYSNHKGSRALAQAIHRRLVAQEPVSSHPQENVGIIEDQGLIAIGSNNSVDAAAVLVECSYIYEPQLQTKASRERAEQQCAQSIYQGIEDFFSATGTVAMIK